MTRVSIGYVLVALLLGALVGVFVSGCLPATFWSQLGIAVGGGVVASFFWVFVMDFWRGRLVPFYEECVYKDAHIEGTWTAVLRAESGEFVDTVELRRKAHKVWGTIRTETGPDQGKRYEINGTFRNLILLATYISTERSELDRGSLALMLRENGHKLIGYACYYLDGGHCITCCPYEWNRETPKSSEAHADVAGGVPKEAERHN